GRLGRRIGSGRCAGGRGRIAKSVVEAVDEIICGSYATGTEQQQQRDRNHLSHLPLPRRIPRGDLMPSQPAPPASPSGIRRNFTLPALALRSTVHSSTVLVGRTIPAWSRLPLPVA